MRRLPIKTWIKDLTTAKLRCKISPWLLKAIEALIAALEARDLNLACELSAVKSKIADLCPQQDLKRNAFQEGREYNESILGHSIYSMIDGINFALAMHTDNMPSGMMIMGAGGRIVKVYKQTRNDNPVLRRMRFETRQLKREVEEKFG